MEIQWDEINRVCLFQIRNGEKKWYVLKDKKLRLRSKGQILLEIYVFFNPVSTLLKIFFKILMKNFFKVYIKMILNLISLPSNCVLGDKSGLFCVVACLELFYLFHEKFNVHF